MQPDAEIEEPKGKPTLSALEKLRVMMAGATQEQMNNVEAAIADGEIAAGKQAALNACKTDDEKAALQKRYDDGELPSPEEIEAGLQLKNFNKWMVARDFWAGYDPVTEKLARQVAAEDFSGLRFGTPKEKHTDSRISISALAKQPDAEFERVLNACLDNIEKNITMENSTPKTRLGVRRIITQELFDQLEKARARVREIVKAAPKEKNAALTPEQKAAQLVYAKLFSDPDLNLKEMIERVAKKSTLQRLVPSMTSIAKQVLAMPEIYQGNMTENFVNEFVRKFTEAFDVDESQVPGLRKAVTEAYVGKLKEAAKKAYELAEAKMTPQEKLAMPKTDKKFWKVFEQLKNEGVLDSDEALKTIAAAKGFYIPTPEEVAAIKRMAERIRELGNPTPAIRNRIQNDPSLTLEEKAKQIKAEQELAAANNSGEIEILQRELAAQWAKLTKPVLDVPSDEKVD